jgi:hypothetical protein
MEAADKAEEAGTDKAEPGNREANSGGQKPETGSQPTEGQKPEAKAQKPEGESQQPGKEKTQESEKAKPAAEAGQKRDEKGQFAKEADKSRYAKVQERLRGGWEELNTSKEALKVERDTFGKEREAFEAEKRDFQAKREAAERQYKPEEYEAAARDFEVEGKFDLAELARQQAAQLRKNPPKAKDDAAHKEWATKAGMDFPELMQDNSPLQVRVAQLLAEDADLKRHPKGMYVAARLASLELEAQKYKRAAAGIAEKEQKISDLEKRVKELEGLTAPGGEGGAQQLPGTKTFEQMSEDEKFAELQREARAVGAL